MNPYFTKLRYLFLPFLVCLVLSLLGYTFLNWLFVIILEWIKVDDFIILFVAPVAVAFLLVLTVLRPGIRRLYFNKEKGSDFFYFLAAMGIAIPTIIAQFYLSTATGTLTRLHNISEIDSLPKTKYYSLDTYYFYKKEVSSKVDIETSGKNNQYMDFMLYTVVPILRTAKDTVAGTTHYWLCTRYTGQVSNYKSDVAKKAAYEEFLKQSEQKFRLEQFPFTYLERISHGDNAKYYGHAASLNRWSRDGVDVLLKPCEGNFADRNGGKLGWIFKSSGIALLSFALLLLCFRLKTASELKTVNRKVARDKAKGWKKNYQWMLPHEGFYVVPLLLYANILVFVAMFFEGLGFISFNGIELISWGSLYKIAVLQQQEWWRLISYMFLHGGVMHMANNLLSLYIVGLFLEPLLGKWRLLMVYMISGICAGIASMYWHDQTNTVGASGAIFGLYGFMLALPVMKVTPPQINKVFLMIAGISAGYSLLMGLVGNVDNVAHVGGLISGFIMGLLLSTRLKEEKLSKGSHSAKSTHLKEDV